MQKGVGDGCQVRPDLVTRAECMKVSRGEGIPKRTVTHIKSVLFIYSFLN